MMDRSARQEPSMDSCESDPDVTAARRGTILLLTYRFPPQSESGALRPFRFAKYLTRRGYHTDILAASCPEDPTGAEAVMRVPPLGPVRWKVRFGSAASRLVQRVIPYNEKLEWVPHAVERGAEYLSRNPGTTLISTSPPNCTHLAALLLKRRFGVKWIADFRDPISGSPFRRRKFTEPYNIGLERLIFRYADAVLAVTDTIGEGWKQRYPQWASKIHVLWNGYDPESGVGPSPIPVRDYRVLSHIGTIYGGRHPKALLQAVLRLLDRGLLPSPQLRIHLLGSIDPETLSPSDLPASELIRRGLLQYENRIIPHAEAVRMLAESDYLLLLDGNNLNLAYAAPAKLFEYMQVGRPILAQTVRNSPVDRILADGGVPYVCVYHDDSPAEIDRKILQFLDFNSEPHTPSEWFRTGFDGERQTAVLAEILDRL
jgi:glycosyltransferase involved in cell wall biosynthesis